MVDPEKKGMDEQNIEQEEPDLEEGVVSGEYSLSEEELMLGDDYITSALAALEDYKELDESESGIVVDSEKTKGIALEEAGETPASGDVSEIRNQMKELETVLVNVRQKAKHQIEEQGRDLRGARRTIQQLRDENDQLKRDLESAEKDIEENKRKWQETASSYINFQKQMKKKLAEYVEMEKSNLLRLFLPVIDNMGRPLEYDKPSDSLLDGIRLIYKQFEDTLQSLDVKAIPAIGEKFDPYVHDAVDRIPRDDLAPNTIIEELLRGYMIGNKVLRPAKVSVSFGGPEVSDVLSEKKNDQDPDVSESVIKDSNSVRNSVDLNGTVSSPEEDSGEIRIESDAICGEDVDSESK